jgi:hypothetical protein
MNNLFAATFFADAPDLPLTDFYIAKYDANNLDLPLEAFKNGEPINPEELRVGTLLRLLRQIRNQSELDAREARMKWGETVAEWDAYQHDQLDKNLDSERCAQ